MPHRLRIAIVVAVSLACLPGAASASAATSSCPNATLVPSAATLRQASDAVLCLINAARAQRGVPALRVSSLLTRAAAAHSADMVRRHYFSHITPGGLAPRQRVSRTGYLRKSRAGAVNETLAIGDGDLSTPSSLVRLLMQDLPHRRIVLGRSFRDVGLGLVLGYPIGGASAGGVTLTVDYGHR